MLTGPGCPDDVLPPITTATSDPAANAAGWNNHDVTVTLSAVDDPGGSGVASITYSVEGPAPAAPRTVLGSTATITVDAEGINTITFSATDNAGNAEAAQTKVVRLDKSDPTVTFSAPDPTPNGFGWNNGDVSVAFEVADSLSGIESSAPASPLRFGDEGAGQAALVTATDVAGNSAAVGSPVVNVDKTAPRCSATATPATLWPANHSLTPVAVTVDSDDPLSGLLSTVLVSAASSEPDNGLGDGDTSNDVQSFDLGTLDTSGLLRAERSGDGSGRRYTLTYEVRDKAGNASTCAAVVTVPHNRR